MRGGGEGHNEGKGSPAPMSPSLAQRKIWFLRWSSVDECFVMFPQTYTDCMENSGGFFLDPNFIRKVVEEELHRLALDWGFKLRLMPKA